MCLVPASCGRRSDCSFGSGKSSQPPIDRHGTTSAAYSTIQNAGESGRCRKILTLVVRLFLWHESFRPRQAGRHFNSLINAAACRFRFDEYRRKVLCGSDVAVEAATAALSAHHVPPVLLLYSRHSPCTSGAHHPSCLTAVAMEPCPGRTVGSCRCATNGGYTCSSRDCRAGVTRAVSERALDFR